MFKPWKTRGAMFAVFVALLAATSIEWGVTAWRLSEKEHENAALRASIETPITGFVARAFQCEANTQTINKAFSDLRSTIAAISDSRRVSVAKNQETLAAAIKAISENNRQIELNRQQIGSLAKSTSGIGANQ